MERVDATLRQHTEKGAVRNGGDHHKEKNLLQNR